MSIEDQQVEDKEVSEVEGLLKGGEEAPGTGAARPPKEGGEGVGDDLHDEHEGEEDERTGKMDAELAAAENDAEREEIRSRRRQERKDKRQRARDKQQGLERQVEALSRTNAEMSQQLRQLLDQSAGAQMAQLDSAINEAEHAVGHFKAVIEDATTKGDGKAIANATEYMMTARQRAEELKRMKEGMGRPQTKALDPRMVNHARTFMGENKWYGGPQSKDPDSRVLSAVDNSLAAEGWDPGSPEYWQELRTRAARYLPHRFSAATTTTGGEEDEQTQSQRQRQGSSGSGNNSGADTPRRGSPVPGSSGDRNKGGGESEGYNLSAERVKAIKEAGAWDDPKRRKAMIERYKAYDTEQKQSQR